MPKTKPLFGNIKSFNLNDEDVTNIKALASEYGVSESAVIRKALRRLFAENGLPVNGEAEWYSTHPKPVSHKGWASIIVDGVDLTGIQVMFSVASAADPTDDAYLKMRVAINGTTYKARVRITEAELEEAEHWTDVVGNHVRKWARNLQTTIRDAN